MDSEDDGDDELNVIEEFFQHSIRSDIPEQFKTYVEHFQRFLSQQTITYIQYCLLRIPFLLAYDYLFTDQFSSLINSFLKYSIDIIDKEHRILFKPVTYILKSYFFEYLIYLNVILSLPVLGFILLILLLLCTNRRLVVFYSYIISLLAIYLNYQIVRLSKFQINMFGIQLIFSLIYIQMINVRSHLNTYKIEKRLCQLSPLLFLFTRYLFSLKLNTYIIHLYYFLWICVHLFELVISQQETIFYIIRIRFLHELISLYENFGIQTLINSLQQRIDFVTLLKIFWLTKIIISPLGLRQMYTIPFVVNTTINMDALDNNITLDYNETFAKTIYFTLLYYGTETTFTLISLACLVSYGMKIISHCLFRRLCLWSDDVEQIGAVFGIMFFLLLFQSNLTRLDLNRRHIPLLKAFSLIIIALFHLLHTILEPELLKVAMQMMTVKMAFDQTDEYSEENMENNKKRSMLKLYFSRKFFRSFHHRHIYTCLSILFIIISYTTVLWNLTSISTWLLAVTAFSLELIVRLLASLAQYTLYVLDAYRCLSNADSFDEYIFRIKAITSCCEFILGIFLLCNGFYILCFEARGALRAFMLAIHAHLNIIKNFRRGWQILRNRRSAWDNVNHLPLATEEQIQNYNDICSICHNILTIGNTCITPCSHLFHQKCLQKAFYATLNCALCLRPIIVNEKNGQQQ
ncbi:unnamed protein product [Rotaria magnacalcarata]|uniref:RING-type domain-containing protein n=1 Tax=Rotaria magnacalcarata TaxID=392030 RepID=A0A818Y1Z9_9BILA|nr:unnamed protein product [Rotaria magnacalcarata]CAF3746438.1 unnamed protein product [Rotaria magnacalcarata]